MHYGAIYAKNSLMKGLMGMSLALCSLMTFAATPEGFWHSIDDKTGENYPSSKLEKIPITNIMERLFIVILYQVLKHCRTVLNVVAH